MNTYTSTRADTARCGAVLADRPTGNRRYAEAVGRAVPDQSSRVRHEVLQRGSRMGH